MKKIFAIAATAVALCALAGCYIGKAEFKGEDMKMYPFFGTSAAPIEEGLPLRGLPSRGRHSP